MKQLLLILAIFFSGSTLANEEGKELHDKACVACHVIKHDDDFYMRENTRMDSLSSLRRQVSMCTSNLSVGWFPDEEKAVIDHLNNKYYKLKE